MSKTKVTGAAIAVMIVAMSVNAWSQPGSSAGVHGSSTAAAAGTMPAAGRKADRMLRRKVYAAIGADKAIDAGDISVTAKKGAVILNGTVTDAAQIGRVEGIAKGVAGVASVTSRLTVKKPLGGM